MTKRTQLAILIALATAGSTANATIFTRTIDSASYGVSGTITLDDWGYTGPGGRTADDFSAINGFGNNALDPTGGIGQIQHVVTQEHDWATPDANQEVDRDLGGPTYYNANMDAGVNFMNGPTLHRVVRHSTICRSIMTVIIMWLRKI